MSTRTRAARGPAVADTGFGGFPDEALDFYTGLEADNSRTYWEAHRQTWERAVRDPLLLLVEALGPRFGEAKVFRPHRDVRFSADKSPYKTHQGAVLSPGDGHGSYYVQVSADGLLVGGGFYQLAPDQLARYRAAVVDDDTGGPLASLVARLQADGFGLSAIGEPLKRAPRGVDPGHPRVELLRHKGLAAMWAPGTPDWLATPRCLDEVASAWERMRPLNGWMAEHVGPAEHVEGDPRAARRGVRGAS